MAQAPQPAQAHGEPRSDVRVVLDGVQPSAAGLRVQVYDDHLAPQLVLENTGGRVLEILDESGRAFLRVGPGGVEADTAAAAWYETLSPAGIAPPAAAHDPQAPVAWKRVRAQPSWGWFDRRLDKNHIAANSTPRTKDTILKRWSVPARLGNDLLKIHGHFLYQPKPAGLFQARLASGGDIAKGLRVTLSQGQPPALLLENNSAEAVLVLGAFEEPFLRIGSEGVEANLASPTWQDLGRYRGLNAEPAVTEQVQWQRVSLAPRYSWLEPRAGMPSMGLGPASRAAGNTRSKAKAWQVPLRIGPRAAVIAGVVEWVPLPAAGEPEPH